MRTLRLAPLGALALSLAACGGTQNRGLETVHQPVVSRTDFVYDVPSTGGLSSQEAARLNGWFQTLHLGYGDRISVDDPADDGGTRNAVAAIAARYGLLMDETAPVTEGQLPAGTFRVVVSRMTATVPNCPDWSRSSIAEFDSHSASNYGCATNASFAAMVANPEDLIHGREAGTVSDAQTGSKAIKTYRTNPSRDAGGLKIEAK